MMFVEPDGSPLGPPISLTRFVAATLRLCLLHWQLETPTYLTALLFCGSIQVLRSCEHPAVVLPNLPYSIYKDITPNE